MTIHIWERFKQISQLASDNLPNRGTGQEKDRLIPFIGTFQIEHFYV